MTAARQSGVRTVSHLDWRVTGAGWGAGRKPKPHGLCEASPVIPFCQTILEAPMKPEVDTRTKATPETWFKSLILLASPVGFEPTTP